MPPSFSQSPAGTAILKGVSRSFYLSLRLLPASMRDAAGLAYLLARSSDTIADTPGLPVSQRLSCLADFHSALLGETTFVTPPELLANTSHAESLLMAHAGDHLRWLDNLSAREKPLVLAVLDEIISGQTLDLQRFGNASKDSRMVIAGDAELIDYCQRVAGSVGAFWTHLGFLGEGQNFSNAAQESMLSWGRNFGCALQLVNILRDRPEDMRHGRYYLPGTAHLAAGEECLHAHDRWLRQAREWVQEGLEYAHALRGRRLRCATALPALIALETLDALDQATWSQLEQRIKVPKTTVFRCLAEAWLL